MATSLAASPWEYLPGMSHMLRGIPQWPAMRVSTTEAHFLFSCSTPLERWYLYKQWKKATNICTLICTLILHLYTQTERHAGSRKNIWNKHVQPNQTHPFNLFSLSLLYITLSNYTCTAWPHKTDGDKDSLRQPGTIRWKMYHSGSKLSIRTDLGSAHLFWILTLAPLVLTISFWVWLMSWSEFKWKWS
jgi:hypothetical protein